MDALMPNYRRYPVRMVRGQGMYLYDEAERDYLDFTSGIGVTALGHAHPAVTAALSEQAGRLVHCSNLYEIPVQEAVAERLSLLFGGGRAFFCNSGAEANEAALKLARRYQYRRGQPERTEWVALEGGFHGRTFGALSVTPRPAYQEGFVPLVPGARIIDPADPAALDAVGPRTAAVLIEVIQGEGGVRPLDPAFVRALADKARAEGALLMVDEVQTGMGRTGRFFAYEHYGLAPDVVTLAKALANGVPAGAVVARPDVAEAFAPGTHGSTFGGNPLAMAAAQVVIDTVSAPEFLQRVERMGTLLRERLEAVASRVPGGAAVRGRGLMWGLRPHTAGLAEKIVAAALQERLLLTAVGDQTVRFLPPLIVTPSDIETAMERLDRALAKVEG
ncbi:MAG: aspartate aminotransferase family protein [Actinomycetia bacterium]|nr:aspartate aminotransferase family protein [Actinomycetes bacterium]